MCANRIEDHVVDRLKLSSREKQVFEFVRRYLSFFGTFGNSLSGATVWVMKMRADGHDDVLIAATLLLSQKYMRFPNSRLHELFDDNFNIVIQDKSKIPFTLSGRDLIAKGVKPGPMMGTMIRAAKAYWLESYCARTTEDLLDWLLRDFNPAEVYVMTRKTEFLDHFWINPPSMVADVYHTLTEATNISHSLVNSSARSTVMTPDAYNELELFVVAPNKSEAMLLKLKEDKLGGCN